MKIGIDLRFINDNVYSVFVTELVTELIKTNENNQYIIYVNHTIDIQNTNLKQKKVGIKNSGIKEQFQLYKILKKDNNDVMLFFNHLKPIFYTEEHYLLIPSLKDIYYSNFSSSLDKYKNLYLLEKNLKNTTKVICFDENTTNELIERFNIKEEKIIPIQGFFKKPCTPKKYTIPIDIKTKYQIGTDFFLYSGEDGIEKNLEKLIYVFHTLKQDEEISMIFIGEGVSKNISLRNLVLEYNIQHRVKFLCNIEPSEKPFFYAQAKGVIFPSLYETFPFDLGEALYFNTPILASNFKSIKNIFGDNIQYFSPISKSSIFQSITNFMKNPGDKKSYESIKRKYTCKKTLQHFLEIIK